MGFQTAHGQKLALICKNKSGAFGIHGTGDLFINPWSGNIDNHSGIDGPVPANGIVAQEGISPDLIVLCCSIGIHAWNRRKRLVFLIVVQNIQNARIHQLLLGKNAVLAVGGGDVQLFAFGIVDIDGLNIRHRAEVIPQFRHGGCDIIDIRLVVEYDFGNGAVAVDLE
ncbi:hypothetical protein D3C75_563700 [compost metagenome]